MSENITCGKFNERLDDFVGGRSSPADREAMEAHISSCVDCRAIFEMKKVLASGPVDVPGDVERSLVESVLYDVAAAREARRPGRSWTQRYLVPAMAAAIVIFVFFTGFLLGELRNLHRETGRLRGEVNAMETVLSIGGSQIEGAGRGRSVFALLSGGRTPRGPMTVGEAARLLGAMPKDTPVLSEAEAEKIINGTPGLRRLAGRMGKKPWEGGLTSGELLLLIISLDLDPDTRIPGRWNIDMEEI